MWTTLRQEIEKTRTALHLQSGLNSVGLDEWSDIERKLYENFAHVNFDRSKSTWIWERLKVEKFGISTSGQSYTLLNRLVDSDTELFLFLNETINEREKFWIYHGTIEPIQKLLEETVGIDEVIILDKKYSWILCINHHDNIIVGGKIMVDKLKALQKEIAVD